MIRGISAIFIVLLVIIMAATVDAQTQPMPSTSAGNASTVIASFENNEFKILGLDSTAFPKIKVNLFIDKFCAMAGSLKKEDFKVKENDYDAAIDNFYFSGNASGQKLDLAIVFDETTSMDEEINALKSKVKDLTQKINSSRLDARYSLVTFNGADVKTKIKWTNDADSFRNIIGKLSTSDGNSDLPENSLDGIERALSFGFRPYAQKVIIVVTDEPSQQKGDGKSNSAYTMDDVKSDLLNSSAMLIAVSPDFRNRNDNPGFPLSNLPKYADMRVLANEAGSLWIDMNSADFSTILKQIQGILTGTYVIEYASSDQTPSENRTVFVSVDAPGCLKGSVSGFYITPGSAPTASNAPPVIIDARGYSVQQTSDGGYIIIGERERNGTYYEQNIWLIKTDSSGIEEWNKTLFGLYSHSVRQTSDGGYIIGGKIYRSREGWESCLIKTDANGNKLWDKTFDDNNPNTFFPFSILQSVQQTSDGGYIIAGSIDKTEEQGAPISNLCLIKTDSTGNKLWDKTFTGSTNKWLSSWANSIQQTSDEGYIIAGMFEFYEADQFETRKDFWLIKTDTNGDKLWDKTFGGSGYDLANSVQQTSDSGYIIAGGYDIGYTTSSDTYVEGAGGNNTWLVKTDANGNKLWDKTFDYYDPNFHFYRDGARSVQQTSDGGYICIAENAFLVKTDANGNKLWDKTFDDFHNAYYTDFASKTDLYTVQQTSDDGYIITGSKTFYYERLLANTYCWLVKTDAKGNKIWDRTFGG